MFIEPSLAPTAIAIWCPSPVFGAGVTGLTSYPMNVLTISGLWSKPPQASTTPRRAPIRRGPSGPSTTTPTTAPASSVTSSTAGVDARTSPPASITPLSSGAISPPPLARQTSRWRVASSSAPTWPRRCSGKLISCGGIHGPEAIFRASSSPSSAPAG